MYQQMRNVEDGGGSDEAEEGRDGTGKIVSWKPIGFVSQGQERMELDG